ncbi:MAG: phosphoenolpyruvate synthase [Desulfobacteraceae bacterium]|nr:phosphoenolpyruvate synthase [Desulfobacteraceae bacterium]MBC2718146.1 phosphoenolpyruvate synthase [Desulfobacteraceae bacterium]
MRRLLNIFRRKVAAPQPVSDDGQMFKERYSYFKKLLSENNAVLEIMADMEEKLSGEYIFDMNYVRTSCNKLVDSVQNIIVNLDKLSKGKYPVLYFAFARINSKIEATLINKIEIPVTDFAIPFESVTKEMVNSVGGKNANLGEIKNRVGLPVPDGFCISAYAFKKFIEYNKLKNKIILNSTDMGDIEGLNKISKEAHNLIMESQIPPDIETGILNAFSELFRKASSKVSEPTASVRSSAIYEDAEFTFAGQYKTALNVTSDKLIEQYKKVIASLFTSRAMFYYKTKGFEEDDMVMAVGVVEMIDARASGIMYSRDPNNAENDSIIINAVWGLGKYAVDGTVSPNIYVVSRDKPGTILEKTTPAQEVMLKCDSRDGAVEVEVPEEKRATSCLTDDQIKFLADYALVLEKHYDRPQDIEWALDENNNFFILQTRPLNILKEQPAKNIQTITKGHKILINKGQVACKGVGAGKVFFVNREEDLEKFPEGAVLVAKHTSTGFVTVMNKTSAIIADVGSPTGHMATLAREYKIPTLLNTVIAMKTLEADKEITVDAINGNIYEGRIDELVEAGKMDNPFKDTAVFRVLRELLNNIAPLNLIHPESEKFSQEYCETFHDITRFAHEVSMKEMFKIVDSPDISKREAVKLEVKIPLEIYIIDLGGGIKSDSKKITPEHILSIPMNALLKGMMAIEWPGPPPINVKGFMSVIASTAMQPHSEKLLWEPSFAIISGEYMNFNIRLGYHIQTIEAYAGDNINDNYARFLFRGGGASVDRRTRRTRLIKQILEMMDFNVKRTGDVLDASITKYDKSTVLKKLGILAHMTAYTKQLDMTLFNDAMVDWYFKEFIKKHYVK